ncbi:MAG TPA: bifunctional (p)ppGpp synthetase/guanosine-3',5'-bis(diphosphate) 3'-pyrophosphohydrolase [Chloroflexia bacterium]|nr:bifunctional (p)ppGpp synthetase/guanosine-3',5'-bis(diphosphate) 3'-pyrophosphohydrolase [Chloroflexia bacterium]
MSTADLDVGDRDMSAHATKSTSRAARAKSRDGNTDARSANGTDDGIKAAATAVVEEVARRPKARPEGTVAGRNGTGTVDERGARVPARVVQQPTGSATLKPTVDNLVKLIKAYNPEADGDEIRSAYEFAALAHDGQYRATGEPYVIHPLQAAMLLADMHLDVETIEAALLHDTIEDTAATNEDITKQFGPTVAHLVEGVTKLSNVSKLQREGSAEKAEKGEREKSRVDTHQQQAENLRKMFLAMFDDPRVVLIKLADRLHNMRTLEGLSPEKQRRIATQTLEIYAPLANRLGMWQMKGELEDLAFSFLNPDKYRELTTLLKETKTSRDRYLKRVMAVLTRELNAAGIEVEIKGRVKHVYSLWQKMQRKNRPIEHIYDVLAVRIIVDTVKDCYAALGVIHSLWPPIPGEFDDYIARPKESMYQSLHTAVWALDNKPLEIQIRTHEMHEIAEYGIAAHWRYKEQRGGKRDWRYEQKIAWLRRLMSWRDEVESAQDFVESLKSDVFQEHIYVFTPQGDIVELPKGATPIDFAYRIHTDLGHQTAGAKMNDRMITLDTPLENGAVVRILKDKNRVGPSRDWLQSDRYIKTGNARQKVRQWFSRQRRDEKVAQGRAILDQTIKHLGLTHVSQADVLEYFPRFHTLDEFLEAIGNTDISTAHITSKLAEHRQSELLQEPELPVAVTVPTAQPMMQVSDLGGILTTLGRCCKPMPGDEIIGYTTKGRGITVHRSDCSNLAQVRDTGRLVRVNWGEKGTTRYPAGVRIEALDRAGLLRDVTTMLADDKVNIISVHTHKRPASATTTLIMALEVTGVEQLYQLMDRLQSVRGVYEVQRDTGGSLT